MIDGMEHDPALAVVLLAMTGGTWPWVQWVLATPVVLFGGWPFQRATLLNARHGASTMDTLVSLGTLTAYTWSTYVLVTGGGELYLEVAVAITTFLLIGRWSEARAKRSAGAALRELLTLGAKRATLEDGTELDVKTLRPGMRFVVLPGEAGRSDRQPQRVRGDELVSYEAVQSFSGTFCVLTSRTFWVGNRAGSATPSRRSMSA